MKKSIKDKIKKNTEEKAYSQKEMKHYLGALNEMHGETLKGINENFVIVNLKIDRMNETLDEHTKMLGTHTEMIASLAEDVTEIKSELKRKVNYDEFNRRVGRLEAKVL